METLGPDELDNVVTERLRHTLSYAQENSEYWSERFEEEYFVPEEVESPEDMLALPPMGKGEALANQPPQSEDFTIPAFTEEGSYSPHCTSGTTGTEQWIFVNQNDEELSNEAVRRGYAAADIDGESVLANFLPKGLNMSGKQSQDAAEGYVKIHQPHGHTNNPPRSRLLSQFNGSNAAADSIFVSPSSAESIATELEEYGTDPANLGINSIMVVGESSSKERRNAIAEAYGIPESNVTNNYANTELGFAAYQSTDCDVDGMHAIEDLRLIMVVDEEENQLVEPGESGEVWVSTLYPKDLEGGTPFFNYKPGDQATYLGRRDCACDRTHKMISEVTRSDNAFEVNQAKISPHHIEDVVHQDHYREVLTGQYEVKIGLHDDDLDEMLIRVDAPEDVQEDRLTDRTPQEFFDMAEGRSLDYDAIERQIREDFLEGHMVSKLMVDGDYVAVDVEVVDEGELDIYDHKGKPRRFQVNE